MNIQGLDYNTSRSSLKLPEYGREVHLMVQHAMSLTDRNERQHCAETIVNIMRRVSPPLSNDAEAMNKYWDHLAVIADFKLDIDYPIDIEKAHAMSEKPQPLAYTHNRIPALHYGKLVAELFERLKTMPEGAERDRLTELTANQMRQCILDYSHGSADVERVADDLAYYTEGRIQLDIDNFRFSRVPIQPLGHEKKRKKK